MFQIEQPEQVVVCRCRESATQPAPPSTQECSLNATHVSHSLIHSHTHTAHFTSEPRGGYTFKHGRPVEEEAVETFFPTGATPLRTPKAPPPDHTPLAPTSTGEGVSLGVESRQSDGRRRFRGFTTTLCAGGGHRLDGGGRWFVQTWLGRKATGRAHCALHRVHGLRDPPVTAGRLNIQCQIGRSCVGGGGKKSC